MVKVLIVDDEELIRVNLRAYFEDMCYTVCEAADGREGLEVYCRELPDLVFTDLRMPEVDGLALINSLRKMAPDLPIIVISGAGTLRDAIEAIRLGAWDYVTKPIQEMECLDIAAKRALERAELIAENKSYREHLEEQIRSRTAELRDSEARFRTLFETANDAILLIRDFAVVTCNRKTLELFGYSLDDIRGRNLLSLSPPAQPDGANSAEKMQGLIQKALDGEPQFYEWTHKRPDDTLFDVETSLNRLEVYGAIYLQAIIRDITIRKQNDALITKLSTAVDQSASIIMITDPQGTIEYVNPRFSEVTGFPVEEAIGKTPRILKSGLHSADHYQQLWSAITSGNIWRGEFCNRRKNGELYWDRTSIAPIRNTPGAVTNFIAVKEDITRQKKYEERLYKQANYDALTGLPNRYLLLELLTKGIGGIQSGRRQAYMMLLGVDNFKYINDTLGHFKGDELLRQIALRLQGLLTEDETFGRFVGDEFVIVHYSMEDAGSAADFAKRVHALFEAPFTIGQTEFYTSACIGIATSPGDSTTAEGLLRNAETAMYQAKSLGKKQTQFFVREFNIRANERFNLGTRLHKALEREELSLHYQPQVELDSGKISGIEALLRWEPETGAPVSPNQFIPVLEETGLIIQVGEWALRRALRQLREWLDQGLPPMQMSVNISALQFRSGHLPETVRAALEENRLEPSFLCLELTESIIMQDVDGTIKTLRDLAEMGILLSIDDFGTGYSSLSYLTRMPLHELKIDRSFVLQVPQNANSMAIVNTILGMADNLDLNVVAEGVETVDQLDFLTAHMCRKGQGYYFSRPLPPAQFLEFAKSWRDKRFPQPQQK